MGKEKKAERGAVKDLLKYLYVLAAGQFVFFSSFDDRGIRGWFLVILDYML